MPTLRFLKDILKHDQLLKVNVSISDIGVFKVEGLRAAIEAEVTAYALNHYRHGVSATFSKPTEVDSLLVCHHWFIGALQDGKSIVCCIEDHQFQPKNYWNGRWRSQWTVAISGQQAEVTGVLKVQVDLPLDPKVLLTSQP